uniref:Myosin phosphatase Rho interacting protein n=1 Tax=Poecilia formosa TaxID=48698 RepID=A0A087YLT3_POEFO
MSAAKENTCRKFQANFFNKSKCQNCFKPRELHLLTDQDLTQQAKPIYAGWLCLAPEGTDFDNPMQRSRKWQRRFFVLYEHGCLRFALDESPSTLPQGTVNMNLCTDVIDAEPKTGQKNSLCIVTPEQEYFIRGENKEIINGWSEQLIVYPRTNKQNQKKKRKVEPTTSQEPGPAKVAVTGSGIPEADKSPDSSSIIWQEELNQREAESAAAWAGADQPLGSPLPSADTVNSSSWPFSVSALLHHQGSDAGSVNGDEVDRGGLPLHSSAPHPSVGPLSPTGSCSSLGGVPRCQSPAPSDPFPSGSSLLSNGSHISGSVSSLDSDASGSTVTSTDSHPAGHRGGHHDAPRSRRLEAEARKAEKRSRFRSPDRQEREAVLSPERSRSGVIEKLEALELENPEKMEVEETERSRVRQGRSERRRFFREEQRQDNDEGLDFPSSLPPLRRAKSLDRRTTESVMTPDLLNFKKGWMVKLDEQGQWKKYWFVLTDHSLRYYKDSIAEEASDLDGEIDLSTCYNVTEYQAQRNYGFQIHTQEGVHTLSAMTAGIRRNWIQAVMKNVRPSTAPDVARVFIVEEKHADKNVFRPDVAQDSPSSEASSVERESAPGAIKSRARERRREGRSKTFDWAEFRPIAQALAQQRAQEAESLQADPDRSRRREERRKRYECAAGPEHALATDGGRIDCEGGDGVMHTDAVSATCLEKQQRVEEVIEEHWRQVEKTPIREERRVPLPTSAQSGETTELEKLLDSYKQGIENLKAQLESCHQQLLDSNKHKQELELQLRIALEREQDIRSGYISPPRVLEKYQETKELLKLQELKKRNMQAQLGLSLSHSSIKEPNLSDQTPPMPEGAATELIQKRVSFLLEDSSDAIQELEDLLTEEPLTLKELGRVLKLHSIAQSTGGKHKLQKLLEAWQCQQEIENETFKKSLARAGESIREYEERLLTMEDMMGKVQKHNFENLKGPYSSLSKLDHHSETSDVTIASLSQRVELLTGENGALKQRCQEIVNQLTEADREIDRLKAELVSQQGGKQHHLVVEELKRLKAELAENQANAIDREYYERELNEKSLRLHEALVTLEELGNTLKDTEKKLQLKEDLLESSQAKVLEAERSLRNTEQRCIELEARNNELVALNQEIEQAGREKLEVAENEARMLRERLETMRRDGENVGEGENVEDKQVDDGLFKQVITELKMRSEALDKVVEMLAKVDTDVEKMLGLLRSTLFGSCKEEPLCIGGKEMRSVLEWEFWSQVLSSTKLEPEEGKQISESELLQQIKAEKSLQLLGKAETEMPMDFTKMYSWLNDETYAVILRQLIETLEGRSHDLKQIASSLEQNKDQKLLSFGLTSFGLGQTQSSRYLLDSLKEACLSYLIVRLKVQHEIESQQNQTVVQTGSLNCPNCPKLKETASDLQSKLEDLQNQLSLASLKLSEAPQTLIQIEGEPIDSVDKAIELQDLVARHRKELRDIKNNYEKELEKLRQEVKKANETIRLHSEENIKEMDSLTNFMENLKNKHEDEKRRLLERFEREMEELRSMLSPASREKNETDEHAPSQEASAQTSTLRERIQELMSQVSVMAEEMRRRDEQGDTNTLRLKYERDLENLKVEALLFSCRATSSWSFIIHVSTIQSYSFKLTKLQTALSGTLVHSELFIDGIQLISHYFVQFMFSVFIGLFSPLISFDSKVGTWSHPICCVEIASQRQAQFFCLLISLGYCKQHEPLRMAHSEVHFYVYYRFIEIYSLKSASSALSDNCLLAYLAAKQILRSGLITTWKFRLLRTNGRCQCFLCYIRRSLYPVTYFLEITFQLLCTFYSKDSISQHVSCSNLHNPFHNRKSRPLCLTRTEKIKHGQLKTGYKQQQPPLSVENDTAKSMQTIFLKKLAKQFFKNIYNRRAAFIASAAKIILHFDDDSNTWGRDRLHDFAPFISITLDNAIKGEGYSCENPADLHSSRLLLVCIYSKLHATCERGFAAMEESHQKVIEELQRKHQRELENLKEEKERLLEEETAATIAAIEAMKNAHRTELEKELEKVRKASSNAENADVEEIRRQHEEELCSFQREIEVLSEQYSQKCLENAHLAQALEAERQALRQCQRENQELNAHNQELNNRLAAEITKMRSMTSEDGAGDPNTTIQGKELYELEVMLRVKESEVQYLKQEINSLKDELQAAQRDKKYATDKYKDIYTELSIVKAKAERDLGRLREQLQLAHEALGEPSLLVTDIMKSKSNPDILKMAAAAAKRSERTLRSKSLKEGLTAEQRLHLFENKDAKEF